MTPEERESLQRTLQLILEATQSRGGDSYKIVIFLIPIVGIIFGCTLLFFIFYWWYKQRIELIRSNLYKPEPFDLRTFSFFTGLLLTFVGLSLSIVFIIVFGKSLAMLGGLIPLAVGFGLLTYYKLSH